jgi:predicted amidohydrolase
MSPRRDGPRPAVIATCALAARGIHDRDQLLANGVAMVDEMARRASENGWPLDMVVLPEMFSYTFANRVSEEAEGLDGRIVATLARQARAYGTYVAVPMQLRDGDRIHNSVVMLDRGGRPVGAYHKVFPVVMPDGSVEGGITPGRAFPVFELEFGRVGVQVCLDAWYDEGWAALAEQEAELVVFPSGGGPTLAALTSHAYRHGYYVAASTYRPPAVVLDPLGSEIARAANDRGVAVVRVDLDYRILPSQYLWTRGRELREKYGDRVDFGWHDEEGSCLLTSRDLSLPIGRLLELERLETRREYIGRNRAAQDAARAGPLIMPAGGSPIEEPVRA